jgi:hypothetical protein
MGHNPRIVEITINNGDFSDLTLNKKWVLGRPIPPHPRLWNQVSGTAGLVLFRDFGGLQARARGFGGSSSDM